MKMDESKAIISSDASSPGVEEIYAGLLGLSRVLTLEHRILRQQLSIVPGDSEEGRTLEGLVALGSLVDQRLAQLLALCRDVGRL